MAHEDMATELRAAGWVCIAPIPKGATQPIVAEGQVWLTPTGKQRIVTDTYLTTAGRFVAHHVGDHKFHQTNERNFLTWARKHNARPTAPTP